MSSTSIDTERAKAGEPAIEFNGLVVSAPNKKMRGGNHFLKFGFSTVLHAFLAGGLIVVPLLTDTSLPEPTHVVRTFFVAPSLAPPPPPPPPPPPSSSTTARAISKASRNGGSSEFVAPIEISSDIEASDGLDLGVEGGIDGGVEGGVAGGVVGGVVGGLAEIKPLPKPIRVGGTIKEPRKIKNVVPEYPSVAQASRVQGIVVLECIIGLDGRVEKAKVVQGMPLLDDAALEAVRQWRYTPTLFQGVPVPVIMTVTVSFRLT
jgi:protein TonB